MAATVSVAKQPINGRTAVTTAAKLLTLIVESGTNTTYTVDSVTDGDGWVLTDVEPGNVLKVVDGIDEYRAQVLEVDAGANKIRVHGWRKGGAKGARRAAMKPTDGVKTYVLKTDRCKRLLVDALDTNSADVEIGFESTLALGEGHPIAFTPTQPNHRFEIETGLQEVIDLGETYVIAASSQGLSWVAM